MQTIIAYTKKIKSMGQNPETGYLANFFGEILERAQIRINDAFTSHANQMRVWVGLFSVVTIAAVRKADFQHLVQGFKQHDIPIDSGQTHGRKILLQLLKNSLNIGMSLIPCRYFSD
jgi:hypothetical protein